MGVSASSGRWKGCDNNRVVKCQRRWFGPTNSQSLGGHIMLKLADEGYPSDSRSPKFTLERKCNRVKKATRKCSEENESKSKCVTL